ncbi:MAG: hypothetical protein Kow0067_08900 [Coriobacteriia bacterium]
MICRYMKAPNGVCRKPVRPVVTTVQTKTASGMSATVAERVRVFERVVRHARDGHRERGLDAGDDRRRLREVHLGDHLPHERAGIVRRRRHDEHAIGLGRAAEIERRLAAEIGVGRVAENDEHEDAADPDERATNHAGRSPSV